MTNPTIPALLIAAMLAVGASLDEQSAPDALLLPTEALHQANDALAAGDRSKQQDIVSPFLGKARKTGLSPEDEMALAELHFLTLNPVDSDAIFVKYLDRSDKVGRIAWIRHQQVLFRAFDRHDQAEADLPVFRSRFPVSPDDLTYTSGMVFNQASRYAAAGNHAKVVELVLSDVKGLPLDLPMRGFRNLGANLKSFAAVNRTDEALGILKAHRAKLQALVDAAGPGLEPASALLKRPLSHRPGVLHGDWDTGNAEDAQGFDRARFNAQVALDRIRQMDAQAKPAPPK